MSTIVTTTFKCDICDSTENVRESFSEKVTMKYYYGESAGVEVIIKGSGCHIEHICKSCAEEALNEVKMSKKCLKDN